MGRKAAHEITRQLGWSGKAATLKARGLADGLLDYGITLASIDPRTHARLRSHKPAIEAVLGDRTAATARLHVYGAANENHISLYIAGSTGEYSDPLISWNFANAIIDAHHGRSWNAGRGTRVDPVKGHSVQLATTSVDTGVTLAFTRERAVAFGNGAIEAIKTGTIVDLGEIDAALGTGDVPARLAA